MGADELPGIAGNDDFFVGWNDPNGHATVIGRNTVRLVVARRILSRIYFYTGPGQRLTRFSANQG